MMAELRENGAKYLEDLAGRMEGGRLPEGQGPGIVEKIRIQEKLREYGIVDIPENTQKMINREMDND